MATTDQIQGALIGHHLGDSMGAPFEFGKWGRRGLPIPTEEIPTTHLLQTAGHHRFGRPAGQPTDDTRCTRLLAEALTATGQYRRGGATWQDRYTYGFVRIPDGCFGRQMRAAKVALKADGVVTTCGQSNGSLMAASPIALLDLPLFVREEMAGDFAYLTHPNPVVANTNQEYVRILDATLRGEAKAIDPIPVPDEEPHGWAKGWCRMSLSIAVGALLQVVEGADVAETYQQVISLGGDTDTNAAIAGALIGAHVGLLGLPTHLVEQLQWLEPLMELGVTLTGKKELV